jgi:hypothetical protein
MKKIPILGLLIGAVMALFALKKKKGEETPEHDSEAQG